MAYTRHNWVCGEVINDTKMNNIEDGIEEALECCGSGAEPLIIRQQYEYAGGSAIYTVYDKTWQEVRDAFLNGVPILLFKDSRYTPYSSFAYNDEDEGCTIQFVTYTPGESGLLPYLYSLERLFGDYAPSAIQSYDGYMYREVAGGIN